MSLYYHIPRSITTAVITFMVCHLFQNYDTIYVRFFATHTCDLSCFVAFFPKYVTTVFFSNAHIYAHNKSPYVAANTSEAIYDNDLEFASDDTL